MSEKSNEVFEVQVNGQHIAYVEAKGKPQARTLALKHVTVEKLSGTRVAQIVTDGKAILSEKDYISDDQGNLELPHGEAEEA